jgi:hypothetical protein
LNRIEYDAYRYDYELVLNRNETNEDIERQYQQSKQRYEKSKDDVTIKLKLLDENRVRAILGFVFFYIKLFNLDSSYETTINTLS